VNFVVAGPEQPLVEGIQPAFKKSKYFFLVVVVGGV
jgi:phosphoribosylamine-glycine ligase